MQNRQSFFKLVRCIKIGILILKSQSLSLNFKMLKSERVGDNSQLNVFYGLQAVKGRCAAGCLMRHHAPDASPQDLGWCSVVERAVGRIGIRPLTLEVCILQLGPVQRARKVDVLAPDHCHLLAIEKLLGNDGCQPAEEVASAINHNFFLERHRFACLSCSTTKSLTPSPWQRWMPAC